MKKIFLLTAFLLFVGWKYSGSREVIFDTYSEGIISMTNGSQWLVYELDRGRAEKWEKGDEVKLIYSHGFYQYDYLALNRTREDCVHAKAVTDGK